MSPNLIARNCSARRKTPSQRRFHSRSTAQAMNHAAMPTQATKASGFQASAAAKSSREHAWRQRVVPQKGHGMPVSLFKRQNGNGSGQASETRAPASTSNIPAKAHTGERSRADFVGEAMRGGALTRVVRS